MAIVESVRSVPANDDDDVGLFIGSARPLAAKVRVRRPGRWRDRSHKRGQL